MVFAFEHEDLAGEWAFFGGRRGENAFFEGFRSVWVGGFVLEIGGSYVKIRCSLALG